MDSSVQFYGSIWKKPVKTHKEEGENSIKPGTVGKWKIYGLVDSFTEQNGLLGDGFRNGQNADKNNSKERADILKAYYGNVNFGKCNIFIGRRGKSTVRLHKNNRKSKDITKSG